MKPFLFVNPLSGSYARKRINTVITRLKNAGLSPTVFSVSTPSEILSCCRQINETADPIQIDGDFVGYSPARITSVPDFARIIV